VDVVRVGVGVGGGVESNGGADEGGKSRLSIDCSNRDSDSASNSDNTGNRGFSVSGLRLLPSTSSDSSDNGDIDDRVDASPPSPSQPIEVQRVEEGADVPMEEDVGGGRSDDGEKDIAWDGGGGKDVCQEDDDFRERMRQVPSESRNTTLVSNVVLCVTDQPTNTTTTITDTGTII